VAKASSIDVIGDRIENPGNMEALREAARLFGGGCILRGPHDPVPAEVGNYSPLVALENLPGAPEVYGFRLPPAARAALVAGNERFGISHELREAAHQVVQIPMPGSTLNTINVAAACAVGLFYLSRGGGGKIRQRNRPESRRPELLFLGVGDHVELGSAIRSAGAFGWSRAFIEDREGVWFGCDRAVRSEGRGAARRGRNSIRLIPVTAEQGYAFREVVVVTHDRGLPLDRIDLDGGPQQLLVIPGPQRENEEFQRLGQRVKFACLDVPATPYFRLTASIALAECARQVGQSPRGIVGRGSRGQIYEKVLQVLAEERGLEVPLQELSSY
jgi:hypothetical protein